MNTMVIGSARYGYSKTPNQYFYGKSTFNVSMKFVFEDI